ncbi:alpha/beta hydrolase family protein [Chitinophaga sp. 22321]|uniref:S9 family peptidase n=1 Tax=Chitinophaga hostae TaxID=2831022 RepID=A0ABS5IX65_9BACT|nr:prolyl oligopeptidase family serine peptidase [Chitinophaga hostae]MBS0027562.1 S9 family peptidase [Chitinophaga hostae]
MRFFCCLLSALFTFSLVFCQDAYYLTKSKPTIDSTAYNRWKFVSDINITNDGNFVSYLVNNLPLGSCTSVLKAVNGDWETGVIDIRNIQFTADSRTAVFIAANDTLEMLRLGTSHVDRIPMVESFYLPSGKNGEWIVYKDTKDGRITLFNLWTGESSVYSAVNSFAFSKHGESLMLDVKEKIEGKLRHTLRKIDLANRSTTDIWVGEGIPKVTLTESAEKLAFIVSNHDRKSIWIYDCLSNRSHEIVNDSALLTERHQSINDIQSFSSNGKHLFFTVREVKVDMMERVKASSVSVWSYLDAKLPPQENKEAGNEHVYSSVVNIQSRNVRQIINSNEVILGTNADRDVFLVAHFGGADRGELNWNDSAQRTYLIRLLESNRDIKMAIDGKNTVWLSPGGRFLIYYDIETGKYFSYDIEQGISHSLTTDLHVSFISTYWEDQAPRPRGVAAWLANDKAVLIYDKFDIWLVDPSGRKLPRNITNGYGNRHNIIFYLGLSEYAESIQLGDGESVVLNALSLESKQNGFFKMDIYSNGDPEKLTMGNYLYQLVDNPYVPYSCISYPLRARSGNGYVVRRMSVTESPNYFFTQDFKNFSPLSSITPEKEYNWITANLYTWKNENGESFQGLLYKPENFDSRKKYPVIVHYYEKKSFGLNVYLSPEDISDGCNINIPTFVSNGYLVFAPDINFTIGNPMQGTFNSVVSAAKFLSALPFVNKNRMGIGGCSFGGLQTNYLVTHTGLFAAAYSASSMSDLVSAYGGLFAGAVSLQSYFEMGGQGRMGGTIWQNPESYIQNSPVFNVDKVSTPLLLMHTTNDPICPFSQAIEFFTALRRLGKKSWLLEYADGSHGVFGNSAKDFGIRLTQFFDHYLKDAPAPIWMTRGGAAALRSVADGLRLDKDIITPGKGLLEQ